MKKRKIAQWGGILASFLLVGIIGFSLGVKEEQAAQQQIRNSALSWKITQGNESSGIRSETENAATSSISSDLILDKSPSYSKVDNKANQGTKDDFGVASTETTESQSTPKKKNSEVIKAVNVFSEKTVSNFDEFAVAIADPLIEKIVVSANIEFSQAIVVDRNIIISSADENNKTLLAEKSRHFLVKTGSVSITMEAIVLNGNNTGGGINSQGANLTVVGGSFEKCHASDSTVGGGIYANSVLVVKNSSFIGCSAGDAGGAIYAEKVTQIENSYFYGNKATRGGAVYSSINLSLTGNLLEQNSAENGGAIYAVQKALITNVTISQNTGSGNGGGIYSVPSGDNYLVLDTVRLVENTSGINGAGLYSTGNATVNSCIIVNNTAIQSGGGLYTNGLATVVSTSFDKNIATPAEIAGLTGGGALYAMDADITDSVMTNNNATSGYGGGIFIVNSLQMKVTNFTLNTAKYLGGGVFSRGTANVTGGQYISNISGGGGAISILPKDAKTFSLKDAKFVNNSTSSFGGALELQMTITTIDNCYFTGSRSTYAGGAIAALNGSNLTITNSKMITNIGSETGLTNGSNGGGAIYSNRSSITVLDVIFTENRSGTSGGVIYMDTAKLTVSGATLAQNSAGVDGGAIYAVGNETIVLNDCDMSGNVAKRNGGAIYYSQLNLINVDELCHFSANRAATAYALVDQSIKDTHALRIKTIYFSDAPIGAPLFEFAYNNFDIGYTGGTKVTFNEVNFVPLNEGPMIVQTVFAGAKAIAPANPQKTGYQFVGWNTAQYGTGIMWDFANMPVTQNMTLFGQYVKKGLEVRFDTGGGTLIPNQEVIFGDFAMRPTDPLKTGYRFISWTTEKIGGDIWDFKTMPVVENRTLYAQYEATQHTVNFETFGGGIIESQSITHNGLAERPEDPIHEGFVFIEWNTATDGTGMHWDFETMPITEALELYAQYEVAQYKITFDSNGGTPLQPQIVTFGSLVERPKEPERKGYDFVEWVTNKNGTEYSWNFDEMVVSNDITLVALWRQSISSDRPDTFPPSASSGKIEADSVAPPVSSNATPTASSTVPPTASNTVPPTASNTVPPTASNTVPPTTSNTVPPTASNTVPPTASNTVPPTTSSAVPPTTSNAVPSTVRSTIDGIGSIAQASSVAISDDGSTSTPPNKESLTLEQRREETLQELEARGVPMLELAGNRVPLIGTGGLEIWALFNLIAAVVGGVFSIFVGYFTYKKYYCKENVPHTALRVSSVGIGIVEILLFLFVSNLQGVMVLFDGWSILLSAGLLIQTATVIIARMRYKEIYRLVDKDIYKKTNNNK